ncbi:hypothetical protein HY638_02915 [Candidatus Woesearchaeota archaeon]|nr:hypothetical protein [Candidatus Woesearchaeota archaeon]
MPSVDDVVKGIEKAPLTDEVKIRAIKAVRGCEWLPQELARCPSNGDNLEGGIVWRIRDSLEPVLVNNSVEYGARMDTYCHIYLSIGGTKEVRFQTG